MNNYFHFKKFTIQQEHCAMKVTEIACIQGAWTNLPLDVKTVLDIGCGTGLLSLMLTKKYPEVNIDAVEIDEKCFAQAKENIENSIFENQINCINADIKEFKPDHQYDFIITNPPFFEHHLKSADKQKNTAWHSDDLSLKELIECIDRLLQPEGSFSILLPAHREADIVRMCSDFSFLPENILQIRHSEKHPVTHLVFIFSRNEKECPPPSLVLSPTTNTFVGDNTNKGCKKECKEEVFTIKEDGNYTAGFISLLREFYLKL